MIDTMTVDEVAARLHVTPRTVRDWIKQGKLAASRVGKHYLIEKKDVREAMSRMKEAPRPATHNPRKEQVHRMRGALRDSGISVGQFLVEKRDEIDREERQWNPNSGN